MYQKELDQIIKAAETFDEAIFGLADMVHWQDGALKYFIEQMILKSIKPALEAECDGCEERCVEKVEFVDGNNPNDTRAYIICSMRDDMGPNEVDMEKLKRWGVNKDKLKELGYCEGPKEAAEDEFISLTEAGKHLKKDKGTISRWADSGKIKDNGQKGQKRKVSKASIFMLKYEAEEKVQQADYEEFKRDADNIPDMR